MKINYVSAEEYKKGNNKASAITKKPKKKTKIWKL